jgi:hypothetical protein
MAEVFLDIISIIYISFLYFSFALIISIIIDEIMGPVDRQKLEKQTTMMILTQIVLYVLFLGILIYFVRRIINYLRLPIITNPYNINLTDISGGFVFYYVLLFFQSNFQTKLRYLRYRLTGNKLYY